MLLKKFVVISLFFFQYSTNFCQKTVELKGNFFIKNFTNKAGENKDIKDFYFYSKGEYFFIKNCESNFKTKEEDHLKKAIILAIEKEGLIDQCDENPFAQSRTGKYIALDNAITETNFGFTLCDISGNCILLKEDTLYYKAISTVESSTGVQNIGQSNVIRLDRNDRIWLVRNFKRTLKKTMNELYFSNNKGEYYIQYDSLRGDVKLISKDFKKWDRFKKKICNKLL